MADVKISDLPATTTLGAGDLLPVVLPGAAADQRNRKMTASNAGKALARYADRIDATRLQLAGGVSSANAYAVVYIGSPGSGGVVALARHYVAAAAAVGTIGQPGYVAARPAGAELVYCETYNVAAGDENNIWRRFGSGDVVAQDFSNSETVLIDTVRAYTIAGAVRLWRATANLNPLSFPPSNQVPAPGTGPQWQELSPSQAPPGAPKYFVYNSELYGLLDSQSGGTGVEPGTLYEVVDAIGGAVVMLAIGAYQLHPLAVQGFVTGAYDLVTTVFTPGGVGFPVAPFVVRSADGLTATGYATFVAARNAALTGERIECYTDCTLPVGVVNEVWMPGYVLTLQAAADISANITARRISGPTYAVFQPGSITIAGYFESTNPSELSSTTTLTLIGGGVVGFLCQPGTVVTLQDGHFASTAGSMFEGTTTATIYLKNASTSGNLGEAKIIDLDGLGRSTPVVVDMANAAYFAGGLLDLTALPFAECVYLNGSAIIDAIIGYNMPHKLRITGQVTDININQDLSVAPPNGVVGWGQVSGGAIVTSPLRIDSAAGFIELRRTYNAVAATWYWLVENSNRGI